MMALDKTFEIEISTDTAENMFMVRQVIDCIGV
jgi:acyl carrier protein